MNAQKLAECFDRLRLTEETTARALAVIRHNADISHVRWKLLLWALGDSASPELIETIGYLSRKGVTYVFAADLAWNAWDAWVALETPISAAVEIKLIELLEAA